MPTAAAAFVPTFISFDDDDDDFGEFEFAAVPASTSSFSFSSPPLPSPGRAISNQQRTWQKPAAAADDDDWGDFVESPLQPPPSRSPDTPPPPPPSSAFFDPFPAPPAALPDPDTVGPAPPVAAGGPWQRPSGALPLSLFGEDEEENGGGEESSISLDSQISGLGGGLFVSSKPVGSNGVVSAQGLGLNDLIASLYGQADRVGAAAAVNGDGGGDHWKVHRENGANSDLVGGGGDDEDEFNESCWEFKDAVSSTRAGDSDDSVLVEVAEKEGELAGVTGVEAKGPDGGRGFQISGGHSLKPDGQKCENMLGANLSSSVLNDEQEWGNGFVSRDITSNGLDFRSTDNGCISNAPRDFEHVNLENGLGTSVVNGDISLDGSFWEFKDASSDIAIMNGFTEPESTAQVGPKELGNLCISASSNENQDFDDSFLIVEGCQYPPNSIDSGTEDVKACSVVGFNDLILNMYSDNCNISSVTSKQKTLSNQNSEVSCETLEGADNKDLKYAGLESDEVRENNFVSESMDAYLNVYAEPTIFVNFYSRVKQKSCTLALDHINKLMLMKADEEEVPDGLKPVYLDGEMQAAFLKLGIAAFESDHMEKSSPNECSSSELLEVLQIPSFRAFDIEYNLSEKIQLAEKDLSSAMWLFEHASYILRILTLASSKDQHTYIISWSKMVSACEKELQHGAMIWSQALHANIQTELLSESQGQQYFLALGEIYRVVEILSASMRLYKAWILLNPADSRELLTCIEKSVETWTNSSLKQALEIISEMFGELKVVTEELLRSIKFISELSTSTLQSHLSNDEARFCRLTLLPLEMQPAYVKQVVWHGDHYFSKVANLWANMISSDAPQLPHIHVG